MFLNNYNKKTKTIFYRLNMSFLPNFNLHGQYYLEYLVSV